MFIRPLPFFDKSNNLKNFLNLRQGEKWDDILIFKIKHDEDRLTKAMNETSIGALLSNIDNGDGVVQGKEINMLNKIFLYMDSQKGTSQNDKKITQEEIDKFNDKIKNKEISYKDFEDKLETGKNYASEGAKRNIKSIEINTTGHFDYSIMQPALVEALKDIGQEQGFEVNQHKDTGAWVEDILIKRPDGKYYIPPAGDYNYDLKPYKNENGTVNALGQGNTYKDGTALDIGIPLEKQHFGTSFLEGGNVLVTNNKKNKPSAIIGESSIGFTLDILKLEQTPENIEKVKDYMAMDLGIPKENLTFIPQYDFHIDMLYRPLANGKMAVPDIEAGIEFLKNNEITGMSAEDKQKRIADLEKLAKSTSKARTEAEQNLKDAGYKIVKIPNFTVSKTDEMNFMNGVISTSKKTKDTFYITNDSKYPEIKDFISKNFEKAGVDKIYFVPTQNALKMMGGIDCLTQETLDI